MTQKLSRKQLYELVWSKPMTQLAKEFGLSDNGLRKICMKYDIPLPQMGHWQKIRYGKKIKQEKLGNFDKWVNTKIPISESEANGQEHYLTRFSKRVIEIEQNCSKLLPVAEKLTKPHALIKAAKVNLDAQKKRKNWRNLPECIHTNRDMLAISVQKHNVPRALRIMDAFIKLVESRGHSVLNESDGTRLVVEGEKFSIRLREKHTRQNITDERWASTQLVPNNKLSIKYEYFMSKEWSDTGTLLEEKLPRIIAFFELKSQEIKEQKERNRIAREQAEVKRQTEQKLLVKKEWESKKRDLLIKCSKEWREAENLRLFIKKIEDSNDKSEKVIDWLNWSRSQLNELDPLSDGIEALVAQFDFPETLTHQNYTSY